MKSTRVTVNTGATPIVTLGYDGAAVIKVPTGGNDVYIGGAGVTSSNGFALTAGDALPWSAGSAETIYGVVASGTQVVHVLTAGEPA